MMMSDAFQTINNLSARFQDDDDDDDDLSVDLNNSCKKKNNYKNKMTQENKNSHLILFNTNLIPVN